MKHIITLIIIIGLTAFSGFGQYNKSLVQQAENGKVSAQLELAKCYLEGNGIDQSQLEAVKWYESAAQKGNVEAMVACGELYCDDWNVDLEPDYVKGIEWLRKAAAKGNKKAIEYISNFDSYIKQEEADDDCPFTWLPCDEDFERLEFLKEKRNLIDKEYRNNNPIAAYYLSIIAYKDKDFTNVVKYLSEIYPLVMDENNDYEDIFEQDESNIQIGATLAAKVFSLLGWCYEHGLGVDKDYIKAADYYLSEFDYTAFGMSMIPKVRGVYCYKKAKLIDKFIDEVNSFKMGTGMFGSGYVTYYVPWLQIKLAEMYMVGDGVSPSKKKALEIYESIVDQRKDLLGFLWGWYPEFRSYSDVGTAAHRASLMYKRGDGCKADEEMADLYFQIALKYGNRSAWYESQNK